MTRTAFITGVCGGIGSATAAAFHGDGWRVVGMDQRLPGAEIPLDRFCRADFADSRAIFDMLNALDDEASVDALVNNAGCAMDKPFLETSVDEWQHTMDVNVRSAFIMSQRLMLRLAERGGAVVNVSSVHAVATSPGCAVYAASKGALVALTRAMALEVATLGVRVNAILPGAVDTPMLRAGLSRSNPIKGVEEALLSLAARTPLGVIGHPSEIASAIVFLADLRRSAFMTGQALIVDGGATARLSTE